MSGYKSLRRGSPLAVIAVSASAVLATASSPAHALLSGGPDVIAGPRSVLDSEADTPPGATNGSQQAFDERQGVVLTSPLRVDGGTIPAGTVVNSHMIFLNVADGAPGVTDFGERWTFDSPVLGVMSDPNGQLEVSSSHLLGAAETVYPTAPFTARGLDLPLGDPARGAGGTAAEGYTVNRNSITVGMAVGQPGDWIRVITLGNRPPDCSTVTAGPNTLGARDHSLRTVALSGLTDPDGDPTTLTVTGVAQDEPVNGLGDGDAAPDAVAGVASNQVQLRSERSGAGDGRVYTISFTGADGRGATCTGTVTVSVPHDGTQAAIASPAGYDSFVP